MSTAPKFASPLPAPATRWASVGEYAATVSSRSERELAEKLGRMRREDAESQGVPTRFDHPNRYWVGELGEAMFADLLDYCHIPYEWNGNVNKEPDFEVLDDAGEVFRTVDVKSQRLNDGEFLAVAEQPASAQIYAYMVFTINPDHGEGCHPEVVQLVGGCSPRWWDQFSGKVEEGGFIAPRRRAASTLNRTLPPENLPLNATQLIEQLTYVKGGK